ncbi:MAG: adenine nucleotide alpha hydrolase family protein [Firmicutes bacterium]|nr:adenine nucleotide alpha hydrolase family protein [Bacillota bacterium]
MKCRKCGEKGVIKLREYNLILCAPHFLEFFEGRVASALRRYRLLGRCEKVLVAVSGGKDSLNTWYVLRKLGFAADGFHIDLGIGEHSRRSREKAENFAREIGGKLAVLELQKELGYSLPDLVKREGRTPCATCGLVKRYLMNREALAGGYPAIATGHNLDDEAATLLSNLLSWSTGYLARQSPCLPSWHPGLARKIKPLCEISEKESAAYAALNKIDCIDEACSYSKGATSLFYKDIINQIELHSPGTKIRFYREFLAKGRHFFAGERHEEKLVDCPECGLPTTHPPCAYCRLRGRIRAAEQANAPG